MTRRRLLVVDDEEAILFALSDYFDMLDFTVDVARTGDDACRLLDCLAYDAIIADLSLTPGRRDGLDVVRHSQRTQPRAPIVIITAYGDAETRREARRIGVAALLDKPLTLREVAAVLSARTEPSPSEAC